MATVRSTDSWEGEFWVTRCDDSRFLAYVRDVAVLDHDGRPLGLVDIAINLTAKPSILASATPLALVTSADPPLNAARATTR